MQRRSRVGKGATELQAEVARLGEGTPETDSSTTGTLHRGWVDLKGKLTGDSDKAVLERVRARRGRCSRALSRRDQAGPARVPSRPIVQRQYEGVKRNHDQIRSLRNAVPLDRLHA